MVSDWKSHIIKFRFFGQVSNLLLVIGIKDM